MTITGFTHSTKAEEAVQFEAPQMEMAGKVRQAKGGAS